MFESDQNMRRMTRNMETTPKNKQMKQNKKNNNNVLANYGHFLTRHWLE